MKSHQSAVFAALDQIGNQSSLSRLAEVANELWRRQKGWWGKISLSTACMARKKWEAKHGKENDCRTYRGQPDRDMILGLSKGSRASDATSFVLSYLESANYQELAEAVGSTVSAVQQRTYKLRQKGVRLPKMNKRPNLVVELNKLIAARLKKVAKFGVGPTSK